MNLHHKHLRHFFRQPQDGVGLVRREMLRVGSAGLFGLSLPHLIAAEAQKVASVKAKNFILMFLEGGPAHQDTWDMKPDAPEEIRGEFKSIQTSLPGQLFANICRCWPKWPIISVTYGRFTTR